METFEWKGIDWYYRPIWGETHPDYNTWFDKEQVSIDAEENLVMNFSNKPKVFFQDEKPIEKTWAIAWIRSVESFSYGTFEWVACLPKGKRLWPALWLASDDSWPPEIDCMEGWSKNNENYTKYILFRNVKPTMHWGTPEKHVQEGAYNICRCKVNSPGIWNSFKTIWTRDYVEVFYNGFRIKKFKDTEMLSQMNTTKFHVIINANIDSGYGMSDYEEYCDNGMPFIIKDFKYTPLNEDIL